MSYLAPLMLNKCIEEDQNSSNKWSTKFKPNKSISKFNVKSDDQDSTAQIIDRNGSGNFSMIGLQRSLPANEAKLNQQPLDQIDEGIMKKLKQSC